MRVFFAMAKWAAYYALEVLQYTGADKRARNPKAGVPWGQHLRRDLSNLSLSVGQRS
jgi:hypothetical protein